MTTVSELIREYRESVNRSDCAVLVAFALGKTKEFVLREPDYRLSDEELAKARSLLDRRVTREPVAYIVGTKEFFGLPFEVTHDTLVPRPETEHLVEEALSILSKPVPNTVVVDIGTGSGAIIVSISKTIEATMNESAGTAHDITCVATDISGGALEVAQRNAARHNIAHTITFLKGNLLDPIPDDTFIAVRRIVILANLPYLSREIFENADDDVRLHEPTSALVADDEGLALYLELLDDIARRKGSGWSYKRVDGLFEISPEQSEHIMTAFASRFPHDVSDIVPDLSGRARVFRFRIAS